VRTAEPSADGRRSAESRNAIGGGISYRSSRGDNLLLLGEWVEQCVFLEYLSILFCAVLWAAEPSLVAVLSVRDSAYVSGTVTFQVIRFSLAMVVYLEVGP